MENKGLYDFHEGSSNYSSLNQTESPPAAPQPQVVTAQPLPATLIEFGPGSMRIQCPYCKAEIFTSTDTDAGALTWILCAVLCVCWCNCGCCLLPFCMRCSKNIVHRCPNCYQYLGIYKRL